MLDAMARIAPTACFWFMVNTAIDVYVNAGCYGKSLAATDRWTTNAQDRGRASDPLAHAFAQINRSEALHNLGKPSDALALLDEAEAAAQASPLSKNGLRLLRSWILAHCARPEEAKAQLGTIEADGLTPQYAAELHFTRAVVYCALKDLIAAELEAREGERQARRASSKRNALCVLARGVTDFRGSGAWKRAGWGEGDGQTWLERRPAGTNPQPWPRKRANNRCSTGRRRPSGGALGLLEQLGLAGWLETGDAAEVGWRASLGEAERLGPQALVAEEALDALRVADQGAQLHAPPAMRAGVDGEAQGQAHQLGPGPVAAARSGSGWLGWRPGVRLRGGRCLSCCRLRQRRYDQWPPRRGGCEHPAVANQMQLRRWHRGRKTRQKRQHVHLQRVGAIAKWPLQFQPHAVVGQEGESLLGEQRSVAGARSGGGARARLGPQRRQRWPRED
jgi:hypothetical protein